MSTENYPEKMLKQIADRCHELGCQKPRIRWAFDNDKAGKSLSVSFI